MSFGKTIGPFLLALLTLGLLAAPGGAAQPAPEEQEPRAPVGFELQGTHGWSISGVGSSEVGIGGARVSLSATRGDESVSYVAPAKVTEDAIEADLGALGRVDLVLHKTGGVKTLNVKCLHYAEPYEEGTWEGVVELDGEHGFTRAKATRLPALPYLLMLGRGHICDRGGSSGESFSPTLPGARLQGVSYAHGRTLKFTFNKNSRGGKTIWGATLSERRDGIRIYRELSGVAPAGAFHYDRLVRSATLGPPAPFSGTAKLTRSPDSVSPLWTGNLELAFPGHTVPLAGPEVHVSLLHARLHTSGGSSVSISFSTPRSP